MEPTASHPPYPAAVSLHSLAIGRSALILQVPASVAGALDADGIAPGEIVEIETRQPFGGPVVVRVGHARVALALRIARAILVEPVLADPLAR